MRKLIILALIVSALSTAAYAGGTLSGYVRDQNGNPIAGAMVWNRNEAGSAVTDSSGYYSLNYTLSGPGFHVYKEGFSMPVRRQVDSDPGGTQDWKLTNLTNAFAPVYDQFNSGGPSLGFTDDSMHYAWGQKGAGSVVQNGRLDVAAGTVVAITSDQYGGNFAPGNFDLTTAFRPGGSWSWNVITYRMTAGGAVPDYNSGETIFFAPNGSIWGSCFNYNPQQRQYRAPTTVDWNVDHRVRLRVVGYRTQIWWDGSLIFDGFNNGESGTYNGMLNNPGPEVRYDGYSPSNGYGAGPDYLNAQVYAGYVGFASFGGTMSVDYVNVSTVVPEPGSIAALLAGMVGLVGFARKRGA